MSKKLLGEIELNRIYQRDCIEGMRLIPDKSVDMILCDLPYGTTACKWDTIIPFEPLWAEYERVIKDNGAIVLTASQPFTSALVMSNPKFFKYSWTWYKTSATGHMNAKKQPLRVIEDVLVFYKKQCVYNPQLVDRNKKNIRNPQKSYDTGNDTIYGKPNVKRGFTEGRTIPLEKGYPKNFIDIPQLGNNGKGRLHPTQKPLALFEYLLFTYSNEGDIVLDNCMGSGTTAIACVRNKRNFIGFELEREYVEIANKRLDAETEVNG